MYARRINCNNQRWSNVVQRGKDLICSNCRDHSTAQCSTCIPIARNYSSQASLVGRYLSNSFLSSCYRRFTRLERRADISWRSCGRRFYGSEGDGRNTSEDKHTPAKDVTDCDKGKIQKESITDSIRHYDAHTRLGEQDQTEWLKNEKHAIENKKKESPFLTRRERFKNEFLRRVVPWEKLTVSWDTFPYHIHEHAKNLLVECAASNLKHKKFTAAYGGRLTSSSGRILLQSIPGTELYRERLVRALAQDLQVPLLMLDSSILTPYAFSEDYSSENEADEDNTESGEVGTSESEVEDENDTSNGEEHTSSSEARTDASDNEIDVQASAEAFKKLAPYKLEDFEKRVLGESDSSSESSKSETVEPSDKANRPLKLGDRVKYTGPSVLIEADKRTLSCGQRGEVFEVNGDQVAVIFDLTGKASKEDRMLDPAVRSSIYWISVKNIEHDVDAQTHDCYVAMEALFEVLQSQQPLIVYFPDFYLWVSRAIAKSDRKEFISKVKEMFDQLSGPVVLISGENKAETGSKEKEKFTMILPNFGRLAKLLTEGFKTTKQSEDDDIYKLFSNVISIHPPKEEDLLRTFNKQIEEDQRIVIARSNLNELHKVLEEHGLSCTDLLNINTDGVVLTKQKAEIVIGWAKNHYLSSCLLPSVKGDRLHVPYESLELAILRLKERETVSKKPSQNLKNLAKDEFESNFVSAVVPPDEIGVKFDDVGALEDVKKALNELVILPMRRPELFSHGNLLRPCKGILLFGPPGTGKTLLAKALATEAGANFISITGSTLTSKWFGDAEKLTRALFSFASKLAPVIIFVDEVDSLLGARGGAFEHEATRRMRNEFMAAWDGLRSKDSQRILILGATNRPFDLDDAVIRRLPRRIYVNLPDAENRLKILKIILAQENLESGFSFDQLANATEGYSGSDLKNLCIAAAYRPVQELLVKETKGEQNDGVPVLRQLNLDDFVQSKAKVGPSVAYDAASMNELRKWNEQYGEGGSRRKSPFGF
ncbi:AAA+-type ATPase [Olea europaea subsp. europaea]|uniref:AAA+-type ATPase n=1 Tax=Olea europaea subsp. europaea TaxID=158383 RepID=A0A8S0R4C0_OLEEU|nr:AAA+-type ATPase [Olea europaea subsp. europaea]